MIQLSKELLEGLATLLLALGGFLTALATVGLQVATFMRQGKQVRASAQRDAKIEELHQAVGAQSAVISAAAGLPVQTPTPQGDGT